MCDTNRRYTGCGNTAGGIFQNEICKLFKGLDERAIHQMCIISYFSMKTYVVKLMWVPIRSTLIYIFMEK